MEKYLCICQYLFVFVTLLNGEQEAVSVPVTNYGESIQTTLMPISTTSSEYDQNQINNTLAPDTEYMVFVKAYTQKHEGDKSESVTWTTDIGPPPPPELINVSCVSEDSLFVQWRRPPKYGQKITLYSISVRPESSLNFDELNQPDCGLNTCFLEINNLTTNTMYEIRIRGTSNSKANPEVYLEGNFSDAKRINLRPNCEVEIQEADAQEDGYTATYFIGGLAAVVVMGLTISMIIIWRMSRSRKCFHSAYYYLEDPACAPITTQAEWESAPRSFPNSNSNELSKSTTLCAEKPDEATMEFLTGCKGGGAIPVSAFEKHVQDLHVDGDIGFSREYESIQNDTAVEDFTSDHSQLPENRAKNRYLNITAYDHSRVHLLPIPSQKNEVDYLNANYIDGFQYVRAYIGTQGPLPSTFECFWRMVWEQRVTIIVMITNLSERGRKKCDLYWPKEDTETYGIIQVKTVREDVMATYTIRTFLIRHLRVKKKNQSMAEKLVYQYHYTNWPDHGTPDHPLPVLHFVKKSSAANPPDAGPIIVHCSAGVGRTGTYIVLDAMLKQIKARGEVNIWGFLRYIRTQRNFLVQTEEQYIFIHDALLEAIKTGCETNVERSQLTKYLATLQKPDESGNSCKMLAHQYALVTQFQPRDFHLVSAYKDINVPKNRNQGFVPVEQWRVPLTVKPGVEGSDYINATWLQGFHSLQEFIITQHPLPHTVLDFWQMVWGNSSQTIVVLSPTGEECMDFWPNVGEDLTADTHRIKTVGTHRNDLFTIREITIESLEDDYELHCRLVECRNWPHCCPTAASIYDLPISVQSSLLEIQNGPVIVVDRYGGTEAASFCVLSTVRKQLLHDDHCDVYMYCKLYHFKRPGVWQTIEDYLRLHSAVESLSQSPLATKIELYSTTNGTCIMDKQTRHTPQASTSSNCAPNTPASTQLTSIQITPPTTPPPTTNSIVTSSNGNIQIDVLEMPQPSPAVLHQLQREVSA